MAQPRKVKEKWFLRTLGEPESSGSVYYLLPIALSTVRRHFNGWETTFNVSTVFMNALNQLTTALPRGTPGVLWLTVWQLFPLPTGVWEELDG